MRVDRQALDPGSGPSHSWEDSDVRVAWQGFVYLPGFAAGEATAERLAAELREVGLAAAAGKLRGNFFLAVEEKDTGRRAAFIDNAGVFHAFRSSDTVATSLRELVSAERLTATDLDPAALVEFFHFGNNYFGRTPFASVRKLGAEEMVTFDPERGWATELKELEESPDGAGNPFPRVFEAIATAARGLDLSVDLTGGKDSRLLASLLAYHGLPFEVALAATPGHPDVERGSAVASVLGRELHVTYHEVDGLDASLIAQCHEGAGLTDVLRYHRLQQLQRDRADRGVSVTLNSSGGELYTDFWWLQDFPFYSRRRPNISKLYSWRFRAVEPRHDYLAGEYRQLSDRTREYMVDQLSRYTLRTNTETYDNIYYKVKEREVGGAFTATYRAILPTYMPLLEPELVDHAFRLPRRDRSFNLFHRRMITELNPEAARLPTTEGGVTTSAETRYILRDLGRYVADKGNRLGIKLAERNLGRSYAHVNSPSPNHPDLYASARRAPAVQTALDALKEHGLLRPDLQLDDVDDAYLGTVLTLGMFIRDLDSQPGTGAG